MRKREGGRYHEIALWWLYAANLQEHIAANPKYAQWRDHHLKEAVRMRAIHMEYRSK